MTNYPPKQEIATDESISTSELGNDVIEETTSINHVEVIENVIHSLEQDDSGMISQSSEDGYLWKFKYGSVEVFVQLTGKTDEDSLTVWATVLKLPALDESRLMRQLLEMNCSSTFEARFGIIESQVVVISIRTLADLSPSEASRLVTVVATIADNNDEVLQSEFGVA